MQCCLVLVVAKHLSLQLVARLRPAAIIKYIPLQVLEHLQFLLLAASTTTLKSLLLVEAVAALVIALLPVMRGQQAVVVLVRF
jgi:hypothetical protein